MNAAVGRFRLIQLIQQLVLPQFVRWFVACAGRHTWRLGRRSDTSRPGHRQQSKSTDSQYCSVL